MEILNFKKIQEEKRGSLTVAEDFPFPIERIFTIENVPQDTVRGQHKHIETRQILRCLRGSCEVMVVSGNDETVIQLDNSEKGLLIEPEEWHEMRKFSPGALLLVLASTRYNAKDYISER
jgi:dTDP-4-dehydrorhamnose 3,5-epimerase-like enzyme